MDVREVRRSQLLYRIGNNTVSPIRVWCIHYIKNFSVYYIRVSGRWFRAILVNNDLLELFIILVNLCEILYRYTYISSIYRNQSCLPMSLFLFPQLVLFTEHPVVVSFSEVVVRLWQLNLGHIFYFIIFFIKFIVWNIVLHITKEQLKVTSFNFPFKFQSTF